MIEEIGNMFRVLKDNEPLTTKFENCDKQDVTNLIAELNELHEKKEILEVQLKSATNEIDKLMSEINTLTDTCHDCCKEIRKENNELKGFFKELKKSGYWNEKCLIEQDWSDLKSWINIVMDRLE